MVQISLIREIEKKEMEMKGERGEREGIRVDGRERERERVTGVYRRRRERNTKEEREGM